VVAYLRQCLALKDEVGPTRSERTAASHHELVRARLGVIYDPERAHATGIREPLILGISLYTTLRST
jgi:hypothetical protein